MAVGTPEASEAVRLEEEKVAAIAVEETAAAASSRGGTGRSPVWCPWDRCGDRTTSGHVLITIERILT